MDSTHQANGKNYRHKKYNYFDVRCRSDAAIDAITQANIDEMTAD